MTVVALALVPVSFGTSLGISIAGGAVGIGSDVVQVGVRVHEAAKEKSSTKKLNERIKAVHTDLASKLCEFHYLFDETGCFRQGPTGPDNPLRGFMSVGNVFRSLQRAAGIVLPAVRVSASTGAAAAAVFGPIAIGLDIAFLGEAVYNITTGENKTGATDLLDCTTAFQTLLLVEYLGDCSSLGGE